MDSYKEKLRTAIDANWNDEVAALAALLAIDSTEGEPLTKEGEAYPFGEGVYLALQRMLRTGHAFGFATDNIDNYGGHIEMEGAHYDADGEMIGTAEETMGIVGHLDVVPAGDGWQRPPFALTMEDASGEATEQAAKAHTLYGRGVLDDKGPVIAALFAMKAVADAGYRPHTNVRLILGCDEETNWSGMDYYLERVKAPDFGFTPDGNFPVIHGEMGILVFDLAKKLGRPNTTDGLELRSFTGGSAPNMVADRARVVVLSKNKELYEPLRDKAARWKDEGRAEIATRIVGKSLEITVRGKTAHGAKPHLGENAIVKMMAFLEDVSFNSDDVGDFIQFFNTCIGEELGGASLGCACSDEPSGDLILNVGQIEIGQKAASVTINIRYPVTMQAEPIYEAMVPACNRYDIGIVKGKDQPPIYVEATDPFVETLMDIYRDYTGDTAARPLVIGGGTYARAFDKVLSFGALFPDRDDCMHQADEWLLAEDLKTMTEIFAAAIYRLAVAE